MLIQLPSVSCSRNHCVPIFVIICLPVMLINIFCYSVCSCCAIQIWVCEHMIKTVINSFMPGKWPLKFRNLMVGGGESVCVCA